MRRNAALMKVQYIRNHVPQIESLFAMCEPDKESQEHECWDEAMRLLDDQLNQLRELEGMLS